MNNEIEKALDDFCRELPDEKMTGYVRQSLDDARLATVACLSHIYREDVTVVNFADSLSAHHDLDKAVIMDCAAGAHEFFTQIKNILPAIESAGYLSVEK